METILKYIKKYSIFFIGIVAFIVLFIIAMVKGAYTTGVMIIPLVLTYISWFCTEINRNKILTLLEKVVNRYQDLVAKYNNLIDDYNKLVDAYKDLKNPIEESEYDFSNPGNVVAKINYAKDIKQHKDTEEEVVSTTPDSPNDYDKHE